METIQVNGKELSGSQLQNLDWEVIEQGEVIKGGWCSLICQVEYEGVTITCSSEGYSGSMKAESDYYDFEIANV